MNECHQKHLPPEIKFIQRGWYNANHVVIENKDGPILIDSGHLLCADETLELLRQNGVAPESIQRIVNTHGHSDHIGGNGTIQRLSGCTISTGPLTAQWLRTNDEYNLWLSHYRQTTEIVPVDTIIEPNTTIDLGGVAFETLSLPGHGPDTIGFYQPDSRVMICADALWEHDVAMLNVVVHGNQVVDEAQASIDKLRGIDIRVAIPGHGPLLTDVGTHLDSAEMRLASFRRDPTKLAWHLVRRILMFTLLRYQPVDRSQLLVTLTQAPWLHDYAPLCGEAPGGEVWTVSALFNYLMDGFLERGTVFMQNDKIVSRVAK